jgi:hypothetical protein
MNLDVIFDLKTGRLKKISFKRSALAMLGFMFVASGLATISGSWFDLLLSVLKINYESINDEKSRYLLALVQILPGIGLLLWKYLVLDKKLAQVKADVQTVRDAELRINVADVYLRSLRDTHSYKSSWNTEFHKIVSVFHPPAKVLRYPPLKSAYDDLRESGSKLENFVAENFFVYPDEPPLDGDYNYCLKPEFNIDRNLKEHDHLKIKHYEELSKTLQELVNQCDSRLVKFVSKKDESELFLAAWR